MRSGTSSKAKVIVHNPECRHQAYKLKILRVQIWPEFTKVDFGYVAENHYIRGGWVRVYRETFLRDCKSGKKFAFIKAENIPEAPEKHYFTSNWDFLYYSLYFEPIPADTETIEIIEKENDDSEFFNFYGVNLAKEEKMKIL